MDKLTLLIACALVLVAMIALLRRSRWLRLVMVGAVIATVLAATGEWFSVGLVGVLLAGIFVFCSQVGRTL